MLHSLGKISRPLYVPASRKYISIPDMFRISNLSLNKSQLTEKPKAYFIGGKYVTKWSDRTEKKFADVIKWLWTKKQRQLNLAGNIPYDQILKALTVDKQHIEAIQEPSLTWIGHSTCYVKMAGLRILTDPVWGPRASFSSFIGPKRIIDPPIAVEELPVDVVLLSHTHYDHLDLPTARRIGNRALWVVPLGVKALLAQSGVTNCVELDWWQTHRIRTAVGYPHTATGGVHTAIDTNTVTDTIDTGVDILFAPAKHWTGRTLFDRNTCLWGSFAVLSPETKFYFGGDTGYCSLFGTLGRDFGPFDFAAIPIGSYNPKWFLGHVHCDPTEAVQIHKDLRCKQSVAVHWGTFPLASEDFLEPPLELARSRAAAGLGHKEVFTMRHGETWRVGSEPQHDLATTHPELLQNYLAYLLKEEKS